MLGPYILFVLTWISGELCLTEGSCPNGWDSVGPGCYKFTTSPTMADTMSYSEASSSCNSMGGKLIVFNDDNEKGLVGNSAYVQQYISGIFGSPFYFWVGCTDEAVEGTFICEDGTQLDVNSGLWETGNPDSSISTNCVAYLPNTALVDFGCAGMDLFAVCEVEPLTDPTTDQPATSLPSQQASDSHRSGFYSMARDNNGSPLIGHCLTDHVMKTILIKSKVRCAAECGREPGCKSFNFKDGVCELNRETRDSVGSSYFSQDNGCLYFEPIRN